MAHHKRFNLNKYMSHTLNNTKAHSKNNWWSNLFKPNPNLNKDLTTLSNSIALNHTLSGGTALGGPSGGY